MFGVSHLTYALQGVWGDGEVDGSWDNGGFLWLEIKPVATKLEYSGVQKEMTHAGSFHVDVSVYKDHSR